MTTSSWEAAQLIAEPDETYDLDASMLVERTGSDVKIVHSSDWDDAAFDPPPGEGYWVLEGIQVVGCEPYGDDETGLRDVLKIGGTWRQATSADCDEIEDEVAA